MPDKYVMLNPDRVKPPRTPLRPMAYRACRFEWTEKVSRTMTLPWCCTRELGHQGQHLAGTGECVAAVRAS
jgi:hypothetical protein